MVPLAYTPTVAKSPKNEPPDPDRCWLTRSIPPGDPWHEDPAVALGTSDHRASSHPCKPDENTRTKKMTCVWLTNNTGGCCDLVSYGHVLSSRNAAPVIFYECSTYSSPQNYNTNPAPHRDRKKFHQQTHDRSSRGVRQCNANTDPISSPLYPRTD